MRGRNLILATAALLGSAVSGAAAEDSACRKAPTRACVLEAAAGEADKITPPYVKAGVLAVIAREQHRFGFADAARSTLQRAEEAQKAIPEDFPQGNIVGGIAGAKAEMGDTAAAVEIAKSAKTPFARAFAYAGIAIALQRKGQADEAKANFALAVEAAQAAPTDMRDFLLAQIAYSEARSGSPDAPATFDLALAAAKARGKGEMQVINQRIHSGDFARSYININDAAENSRAFLLRLLVKYEAEAGALDDAAASASAISDESDGARAAVDVAVANFRAGHAMAGAQWLVKAQEIGANARVPATKAEATADVAGASAVAGMDLKAKGQIEEARSAAEKETSDVLRAAIYEAIARALARSGRIDDAIAMLNDKSPKALGFELSEIADDRVAARQWGDAFAAFEAIPNDNMRASLLVDLAGRLPQ